MGSSPGPALPRVAYSLMTPLAAMGVAVWLPAEAWQRPLLLVFVAFSALCLLLFPRDIRAVGSPVCTGLLALLGSAAAVCLAAFGQSLVGILAGLLCLWLLRLWYIRQYHARHGEADKVEILRRCLLIALWSHISVIVLVLSPYRAQGYEFVGTLDGESVESAYDEPPL